MPENKNTPMMRQYRQIKGEHKDAVLFFRLGDFYEMFEHDAKEVSRILNITLTTRHGIPMCGIPYHAASSYIPRLLRAGKKIAVCEQTELPQGGKGIAKRKVVEIITPGTVVEEDYLEASENNYILSLSRSGEFGSITYADISTGEFQCTSFPWTDSNEVIRKEIWRIKPAEIIIQESLYDESDSVRRILQEQKNITVNRYPDWSYSTESSYKEITSLLKTSSLKGFGIEKDDPAIYSSGVLLDYLNDTSKSALLHIRSIKSYTETDFLNLDESTQRNLELVQNLHDGSRRFSLLDNLDQTKTPMGGRLIRKWILHPLKSIEEINERITAVRLLYHNQILLNRLSEQMSSILDLERLSSRLAMNKAHGKDMLSIKNSLLTISGVIETLKGWEESSPVWEVSEGTQEQLKRIIDELEKAVHEDPSIVLTDGRLIKAGYSEELDELRGLRNNSRDILDQYLEEEKAVSNIQNLKIKYNKIIGYFFDVSRGNLHLVPDHFIRRQTLVNGERFTTDRLIELETKLNSASEKALDLEKDIFLKLREEMKDHIPLIQDLAEYISRIDVLASFAKSATLYGYSEPVLSSGKELIIREGRHPVVENNMPPGDFVANNLSLGTDNKRFALITGPNMAGKSTYLRQNALIALMAQIGSYVPASEARIGLIDKIFCRVGASDNLARGESTFLVEMNETAHILNAATDSSLVIMDEVGRGTSTNDGLSIAWAVSEYLSQMQARTLFATHYHELTQLNADGLFNVSLEVIEDEGDVIFLKRIKDGPAGNSYGIHVAKLAGIPRKVIDRSGEILLELTKREHHLQDVPPVSTSSEPGKKDLTSQKELFSSNEMIIGEIQSLQVDSCTPLQALNLIAKWKKQIQNESPE